MATGVGCVERVFERRRTADQPPGIVRLRPKAASTHPTPITPGSRPPVLGERPGSSRPCDPAPVRSTFLSGATTAGMNPAARPGSGSLLQAVDQVRGRGRELGVGLG